METLSFASATLLLVLTADPLGNLPLFLAELKKVRPERRAIVIARECIIATVALLAFLYFGRPILGLLHLQQEALQTAGGVILLLIAIRMIFPHHGAPVSDETPADGTEPFIVPLAIPLIAGPSMMATAMLMATRHPGRLMEWTGALLISMAVTAVVFAMSTRLQKLLGDQVITAMERLMGLILSAIATDMLLRGVASYFRGGI